MSNLRFIHAADLHLDSPFKGLRHVPQALFQRIQESTFTALKKVIDAAIEHNVDFVVIVGDLFDGEDRSIKAQARLGRELNRLAPLGIHVFITHGNHDHLGGNWVTIELPEHVHIFPSSVSMLPFVTKHNTHVHLYGFSYPKRHVVENMAEAYIKKGQADFHIALLHGHGDGNNTNHQPYAPFTIQQLIAKEMNYWALGHIHKQKILHNDPYIVYPGNTQGRHINEKGIKGCFDVQLSQVGQQSLKFIPTSDIVWSDLHISCHEGMTFTDLLQIYHSKMREEENSSPYATLGRIEIQNVQYLQDDTRLKLENGEFLEMVQEGIQFEDTFFWPYELVIHEEDVSKEIDPALLRVFETTIEEINTDDFIDEALSPLYSHIYASRFLEKLSATDKQIIVNEAKRRLIHHIMTK